MMWCVCDAVKKKSLQMAMMVLTKTGISCGSLLPTCCDLKILVYWQCFHLMTESGIMSIVSVHVVCIFAKVTCVGVLCMSIGTDEYLIVFPICTQVSLHYACLSLPHCLVCLRFILHVFYV